jgi:hypothetical protein
MLLCSEYGSKAICGFARLPRSQGCTVVQAGSVTAIIGSSINAVSFVVLIRVFLLFVFLRAFPWPVVFAKRDFAVLVSLRLQITSLCSGFRQSLPE